MDEGLEKAALQRQHYSENEGEAHRGVVGRWREEPIRLPAEADECLPPIM